MVLPSHILKSLKRILGAGGEITDPVPPELLNLVAVYIATMRQVSLEEPTIKDLALLLTLLVNQAPKGKFEKDTKLYHSERSEWVRFHQGGPCGFSIVQSPTGGMIWAQTSHLSIDIPQPAKAEPEAKPQQQQKKQTAAA